MARKTVEPNIAYDDVKRRYYVTQHLGTDAGGRRLKRCRCFSTLKEARTWQTSARRQQTLLGDGTAGEITVAWWLNYWLENIVRPNHAVTTAYGYENIVRNHLIPDLGSTPLTALSAPQVQQYIARKQAAGLAPNTIRKHLTLLSTALSLAERQEVLGKNVVRSVEPPPKTQPEHRFYSPEELQRLFRLSQGKQIEPVVKLAGYLGLRRSEICGLRWEDVDLERCVVHVCRARTSINGLAVEKGPKSPSSVRQLSFAGNEDLVRLLRLLHRRFSDRRSRWGADFNPEGYVIAQSTGRPYAPDYLSLLFARFIRRNQLPPCTLHGLRHSFASIANSQRVPLFSICKALGHSNTNITSQIYLHLFDDTHREVVDLVGQAIQVAK